MCSGNLVLAECTVFWKIIQSLPVWFQLPASIWKQQPGKSNVLFQSMPCANTTACPGPLLQLWRWWWRWRRLHEWQFVAVYNAAKIWNWLSLLKLSYDLVCLYSFDALILKCNRANRALDYNKIYPILVISFIAQVFSTLNFCQNFYKSFLLLLLKSWKYWKYSASKFFPFLIN